MEGQDNTMVKWKKKYKKTNNDQQNTHSKRAGSSCSTSGTRRVIFNNLVTVMIEDRKTGFWVPQISEHCHLRNIYSVPSINGEYKTFEAMSST